VEALFDTFWDDHGKSYRKASGDRNAYTTGVIGSHNVVLAYMPGMGKGSAASVASSFRSSFEGIRLALVVGICGGVPFGTDDEKEILLGDVIISDGLIQYDFGRQLPYKFMRKDTLQDSLGRPNTEIRALLAKLKGHRSRMRLKDNTSHYLTQVQENLGVEKARYPGVDADKLFEPTYRHKHHNLPACSWCTKCEKKEDEVCQAALDSSCSELKCNENKLVPRHRLLKAKETSAAPKPIIHYGLIASGDTVMKSGEDRDTITTRDNIIAFEMEGAGVWDNLPCVVIKGVCDYADSHKNKEWQGYAAATAASCMKAFLKEWVSADKAVSSTRNPTDSRKRQRGYGKKILEQRQKRCLENRIPSQVLLQEPVTFFDALGDCYPIHLDFIQCAEVYITEPSLAQHANLIRNFWLSLELKSSSLLNRSIGIWGRPKLREESSFFETHIEIDFSI